MNKRLEFLETKINKHEKAATEARNNASANLALAGLAGYLAFRLGVDEHVFWSGAATVLAADSLGDVVKGHKVTSS